MYNNSRENHGIKSICYISRSPQGKRRKSEIGKKLYAQVFCNYFFPSFDRSFSLESHDLRSVQNLSVYRLSSGTLSEGSQNGTAPCQFFFLFSFFFISINSHRLLLVVKYLIIISYLVRLRPKEHLRFFFLSILFVYTLIPQLNI